MPSVIHSDQGREFANNLMQELCLFCGAHKTRTTPYHPASDGLVEWFNRTLLMMLAMFAGENRDDWDDLLPAVMMAYRSSVHESTSALIVLCLGNNVHCLWMSASHVRIRTWRTLLKTPMLYGSEMRWKWHMTMSVATLVRLCYDKSGSMINGLSDACLQWEIGLITHQQKKMQTRFTLDRALSCCVVGRMGCWYSATTGFTSYPGSLSGHEDNSTPQWSGVVDRR